MTRKVLLTVTSWKENPGKNGKPLLSNLRDIVASSGRAIRLSGLHLMTRFCCYFWALFRNEIIQRRHASPAFILVRFRDVTSVNIGTAFFAFSVKTFQSILTVSKKNKGDVIVSSGRETELRGDASDVLRRLFQTC